MVTSAGTRNVLSAEDLFQRASEDEDISPALLERALERLESESRLVRRERRRDLDLYEVTSEFLLPWISRRQEEFRRLQERARERRRLRIFGSVAAALALVVAIIAAVAVWALGQRSDARHQANEATSLALASAAEDTLDRRPDISLPLALEAYGASPRAEARSSLISAREAIRGSGVVGILHGHAHTVTDIAFSPDGRTLASASADETLRLWDVATHTQVGQPLSGHDRIVDVAFSQHGRTLVSASDDATVRTWDVATQRPIGRAFTAQAGSVETVALSPDGRTLAIGSCGHRPLPTCGGADTAAGQNDTITLWDLSTHRSLGRVTAPGFTSLAFSQDGHTLASGGFDTNSSPRSRFESPGVRLWDVATQRSLGRLLTPHADLIDTIDPIAFRPDGKTLATAETRLDVGPGTPADHPTIRLWQVASHRQLWRVSTRKSVRSLTFSPNGRTLASGSTDKTIRLWDVETQRSLGQLTGHGGEVEGVAFSPDGRTLASASADNTIRLWDVATPRASDRPLTGHTYPVARVAFSPDGRTLASVGYDDRILLWDATSHMQVGEPLTADTGWVREVAFSPDGRTLAAAIDDRTIRLWDVSTHARFGEPLVGATGEVVSVAFSPDGRTLASVVKHRDDKTIRLWDVGTQRPIGQPITRHTEGVHGVEFSPDARTLAFVSSDRIRLWDVEAQAQLGKRLTGHTDWINSVAFSPDGRTLASAGYDRTIRLWDVETQAQVGEPITGHTGVINSVAFTPDGRTVASASDDRTVRLWDVATHAQLGAPLKGHTDWVSNVVFSPDGRTLASASGDKTIRLWEGILWDDFSEVQNQVCNLVGTGLTETEWKQYVGAGITYRQSCP